MGDFLTYPEGRNTADEDKEAEDAKVEGEEELREVEVECLAAGVAVAGAVHAVAAVRIYVEHTTRNVHEANHHRRHILKRSKTRHVVYPFLYGEEGVGMGGSANTKSCS